MNGLAEILSSEELDAVLNDLLKEQAAQDKQKNAS